MMPRYAQDRPAGRIPTVPFTWIAAALLALLLGLAPPPTLSDQLTRIINQGDAASAFWGLYVRDLETGEVLVSHNADKGLVPASNMKLITTAAALDALGPDYRYQTTLHLQGAVEDSVLRGDLILEGSGDPTFGTRELDVEDALEAWAERLAEMGVRRIEGRLIGDDDVFDDRPYAEGWDVDFVTKEAFAPAAGGLSYRDNLATVYLHARRAGTPPELTATPENAVQIRNRIDTHGRRRGQRLRIDRSLGSDAVTLTGSLPAGYRGRFELPVTDPTRFTLASFQQRLEDAGIEVDAELVDVDELDDAPAYDDARPLFVHFSPPLSEILRNVNKESNNFFAEQVFRTIAWGGSTEGGERRVKAFLERAGVEAEGLSIVDGSGLSRKDMITPQAMGTMLAFMDRHEAREVYRGTLAEGGETETTLRYRLKDVPVYAKTGSLKFVRTLSGYTTTGTGRRVAFVVFANNFTAPSYRITRTIDEVVRTLSSSGAS